MRELCPECKGEAFVITPDESIIDLKIIDFTGSIDTNARMKIVCPRCHGKRWIDSWRRVEDELPPRHPEIAYASVYVDLCNWTPDLNKTYFFWERVYYHFVDRKWYDVGDNETFGNYWRPIEPPEE